MKTLFVSDPVHYPQMSTQELRQSFLLSDLVRPGQIHLHYVDLDRAVVGIASPFDRPLKLESSSELRASFFTERRELGALNVGHEGLVHVDGTTHALDNLDVIYIGQGNREISFESKSKDHPAVFYILSYPAHTAYPVALVKKSSAEPTQQGSASNANLRTIYKYIHAGGKSCQLVLGVTHLHQGSTWNTMPPHTHARRSEVYFYFDLAKDARIFHLMGPPQETRHLVVSDREAVVSPGWSIHAGVGTQSYRFCWGMGGENQDYTDMDAVGLDQLL